MLLITDAGIEQQLFGERRNILRSLPERGDANGEHVESVEQILTKTARPHFPLEVARRGAWIEYDAIGSENRRDAFWLDRILGMLDAGFGDQIMLSHDRGWYDPGQPGGGTPRPFTYISEHFLPQLEAEGVSGETIQKLVSGNPFDAFSR